MGIIHVSSVLNFSKSNYTYYFLSVYLISPLTEEIVFRGIVMTKLRTVWDASSAIFISALIFGLIHSMTGSILIVLFAFGGGLIFALCYEKTRSLLLTIIIHATGNVCDLVSDFFSNMGYQQYFIMILFGVVFVFSYVFLAKER